MLEAQKEWLKDNPKFEVVRNLGVVTTRGYADKAYLLRDGRLARGEMRNWGGLRVITGTDTLYTNVEGAVEIGRPYDIC